MPKYRIVSDSDPGAEHREPPEGNLSLSTARLLTVIDSENLFWATGRRLLASGGDLQ
ncbi:hypothetical protein ACFU99_06140 [Streptomyces sp. NPDC057654]|uniref:hypothetical protein n=1 Tax=Streptomyces sp. NPDC057654 TaxID=3346196 RepID=UPI0036BB3644